MSDDDSPRAPGDRDRADANANADAESDRSERWLDGDARLHRTRERVDAGADRAMRWVDRGVVGVLARVLTAEERVRVYAALRARPNATVSELADAVDRYPADVHETLAALREEGAVRRVDADDAAADLDSHADADIAPDSSSAAAYRALPPREIARDAADRVRRHRAPIPSFVPGADDTTSVSIPIEERDPDEGGRPR